MNLIRSGGIELFSIWHNWWLDNSGEARAVLTHDPDLHDAIPHHAKTSFYPSPNRAGTQAFRHSLKRLLFRNPGSTPACALPGKPSVRKTPWRGSCKNDHRTAAVPQPGGHRHRASHCRSLLRISGQSERSPRIAKLQFAGAPWCPEPAS